MKKKLEYATHFVIAVGLMLLPVVEVNNIFFDVFWLLFGGFIVARYIAPCVNS